MASESDPRVEGANVEGDEDWEPLEPSLQNVVDQQSLQWVFVGGKGGVGKTTTSCCLALRLAASRTKVLVVSTDPAHNLSDAFGQKFGRNPVQVNGHANLFCMEVDPTFDLDELSGDGIPTGGEGGMQSLMKDLMGSFPGIDEAMGFAEIMKQVQTMDYDVVVFDTAPTGHTLRLLSFPTLMEKALSKLSGSRLGGMMQQAMRMMGGAGAQEGAEEQLMGRMEQMREIVTRVNEQFQDPDRTTFVCVCIPEFLSLYETERLVQELTKFGIDTHNIVVNQVLFPDADSECRKCLARQRMQRRYLEQIYELYEDFHVVTMPLLDCEVRGVASLQAFSQHMLSPYTPGAITPEAETAMATMMDSVLGGAGASNSLEACD